MWGSQLKALKLNINYRATETTKRTKRMSTQPIEIRKSRRQRKTGPELRYSSVKKNNPSFKRLRSDVQYNWQTVCNIKTKDDITVGIDDKFAKDSINNCNMLYVAKVGSVLVGFITVFFHTYDTPLKPSPNNAICGEHEWYIDLICAKPGNGRNMLIGLMGEARKENEKNEHNKKITQFRAHTLETKRPFFVKNGFVEKDNASNPNEKETQKYYKTRIGRIWKIVDVSELEDVRTITALSEDIQKRIKEIQKKEGPSAMPEVIDLNLEEPMSDIQENRIYRLGTNQFIKPIIVDDIKHGLRMTLAIPVI